VFRFRRGASADLNRSPLPFTEIPDELRRGRFSFGRLARGVLNFLFLLILGLALAGLVFAFAYQMINNPDTLQAQANSIVTAALEFFQALIPAAK